MNLSSVITDIEDVLALLTPAAVFVGNVSSAVPSGSTVSTFLNTLESDIKSIINATAPIEADIADIVPEFESAFSSLANVVAKIKATNSSNTSSTQ